MEREMLIKRNFKKNLSYVLLIKKVYLLWNAVLEVMQTLMLIISIYSVRLVTWQRQMLTFNVRDQKSTYLKLVTHFKTV